MDTRALENEPTAEMRPGLKKKQNDGRDLYFQILRCIV